MTTTHHSPASRGPAPEGVGILKPGVGTPGAPQIIAGAVLWTPAAENVIDLDASAAVGESAPALEFPALIPIDLNDSHGIEITPQRLEEMAAAYDPAVEMASLNLDHNYGGPSLGWCERVWLQEGALWVRYTDLDPATIELIRSKRYTRRSAEIALSHPVTGGWYFTGCALLGNARPAVAGLPPVTLCRPQYILTTHKEEPMEIDPAPPEAPPTSEAVLATMQAQLAESTQVLAAVLRNNAESEADRRLTQLGARITPAMAKLARPLLVELLAERTPRTVRLQADPSKPAADVSIAEQILQVLAAVPAVEALTTGRLADTDPAPRTNTTLTPEREAELQQKYRFTTSWGFRA